MTTAQTLFQEGLKAHHQGQWAHALACYEKAISQDGQHAEALHLSGVIHIQQGNWLRGAELIAQSIQLQPNNFIAHNNLGNAFFERQQYDNALDQYDRAIQLNPQYAQAYLGQGKALINSERPYSALASFAHAIQHAPNLLDAHLQLTLCQAHLRQFRQATTRLQQLAQLWPGNTLLSNTEQSVHRMQTIHQQVLARTLPASLHRESQALSTAGLQAHAKGFYSDAIELFNAALEITPQNANVYYHKGNAYLAQGQYYGAIECYDHATSLEPRLSDAWHNAGSALCELRQYPAAIQQLTHAIQTTTDIASSLFMKLMAQLNICDWSDYDSVKAQIIHELEEGHCPMQPLQVLAISDSLEVQLSAAKSHFKTTYSHIHARPFKASRKPNNRIKVGYFSQDFREHAVSYLTAELFELHDRQKFEVIAFNYGNRNEEAMQKRLRTSFDQFHDVKDLDDDAIVQMARDMNLDIAVDLAGYTANNRSGIFAQRAAPVQINYLGYPASMGHPQVDYLIGDPIVTPPELRYGYSEKIISLPCFQVNDRHRKISNRVFTRTELGIIDKHFVFCCFNATYKINPNVFSAWLDILKACPNSSLLLVKDHDQAEANLKRLASMQGIDAERLIFCTKVSPEDNLARYRVADLFLDSWPFNAGTTASDALWAGLPVLTCTGHAFASRMAASLLHAVGLEDLVTNNLEDYMNQAIAIASDPAKAAELKLRLKNNRLSQPLFNTPYFVSKVEAAFTEIHHRQQHGLAPADIELSDSDSAHL